MTEWGPWDHSAPLVRMTQDSGDAVQYDLRKMPDNVTVTLQGRGVKGQLSRAEHSGDPVTVTVSAEHSGLHPYQMHVRAGAFNDTLTGTLISAEWDTTFFTWTEAKDPREHLEAWRTLASGDTAVSLQVSRLSFQYGGGGPSTQLPEASPDLSKLGQDHFGMIARTRLALTAGTWEFATLSDDGIRVVVDGHPVIENWTWHGPTRNAGEIRLKHDKTVEIVVEHFEIDGYAVLDLEIAAKE